MVGRIRNVTSLKHIQNSEDNHSMKQAQNNYITYTFHVQIELNEDCFNFALKKNRKSVGNGV